MCGRHGRPRTRSPRLFPRDRGLRSVLVRSDPPFPDASRHDPLTQGHHTVCAPSAPTSPNGLCGTLRRATPTQVRCPRCDLNGCRAHLQLRSAAQRFDEGSRRVTARRHTDGGTVCGGRDGLRHAGPRRPGRPGLAPGRGRLHDGRLSTGRGGVPHRGADRSRDGRRLARAARAARRHDDGAAQDVPAPRALRRAADPPPPHPQLLVLAGLVGATGAGESARPAPRARLALAGRPPCARA